MMRIATIVETYHVLDRCLYKKKLRVTMLGVTENFYTPEKKYE